MTPISARTSDGPEGDMLVSVMGEEISPARRSDPGVVHRPRSGVESGQAADSLFGEDEPADDELDESLDDELEESLDELPDEFDDAGVDELVEDRESVR
ncbi:hypothetical protein GCM10009547_01900 [Sporichthya brevicatena]|uniref:Uncharacterized protein n=1 Tax=Sporichthya brevicatena TaxID=171442 RepID=A0ABN1G4B8_9ACTN